MGIFYIDGPTSQGIGVYLLGTYDGRRMGIRPSNGLHVEWLDFSTGAAPATLDRSQAQEIQSAWFKTLKGALSWNDFAQLVEIPHENFRGWMMKGKPLPYARAVRLAMFQDAKPDAKPESAQKLPISKLFPHPRGRRVSPDDPSLETSTDEIRAVAVEQLEPHPRNREFPTSGEEWEQFVESIRLRGICFPILVRPVAEGRYQIVAGHRRTAAARQAGMGEVSCIIQAMDDRKAMEMVGLDSISARGVTPVDEAHFVAGLMEVGMDTEAIATRICRDPRWVRTRQGILELGEEVQVAMKLPKEDPRHLGVRTVEEILKVPEPLRAEAIQLVLHPDFEEGTLSPRQAAEVLQTLLGEPWHAKKTWEEDRVKLAKGWKKRLEGQCLRGTRKELLVVSVPWEDTERVAKGGVPAEKRVPLEEQSADAPQFLQWLHLAVRHGQAVRIVHDPAGGQDRSLALVDQRVLIEAEEAHGEAMCRAERELATMQAEARDGKTDLDRAAAAGRVKELQALIKSLLPWVITKARGRLRKHARQRSPA